MKASLLLIVGDEEVQRYVFEQYGFGYWTACFDILLEKHGFLSLESAPPDVLTQFEKIKDYDYLIISWLPERFWQRNYLDSISRFDGPVFMEGPFPNFVDEYLGLFQYPEISPLKENRLLFCSPELGQYLEKNFSQTIRIMDSEIFPRPPNLPPSSLYLGNKKLITKAPRLNRDLLNFDPSASPYLWMSEVVLSYLMAYKSRFEKKGLFFENPILNALTLMAWLKALNKTAEPSYKDEWRLLVDKVLQKKKFEKLSGTKDKAKQSEIEALWALVILMASEVLGVESLKERGLFFVRKVSRQVKHDSTYTLLGKIYVISAYAKCEHSEDDFGFVEEEGRSVAKALKKVIKPIPVELWAGNLLAGLLHPILPNLAAELFSIIRSKIAPLLQLKDEQLPAQCEGMSIWEILLISGTASKLGIEEGLDLISFCYKKAFDFEKGFFHQAEVYERKLRLKSGYQNVPWVVLGLLPNLLYLRPSGRPELIEKNYSAKQVTAWQTSPYWIRPYGNRECQKEAIFAGEDEGTTALFRNKNIIGSTFQILSYLVYYHTLPPLKEALFDCPSSHILLLESALFHFIEKQASQCNTLLPKIAPWPWNKKYCFTVRHDVDRVPNEETFHRFLSFEKGIGLGVSWYWMDNKFHQPYIHKLQEVDHEIGLHSVSLSNQPAEKEELQACMKNDKAVKGNNWHGTSKDYGIGHPAVVETIRNEMLYTELMPTIYDFPYFGFPTLDERGRVERIKLVGITSNASVDPSPRKEITINTYNRLKELIANGYYCVLLSHPDLNFEAFRSLVLSLPQKDRVDWSCIQVAQWWRRTHTCTRLSLKKIHPSPNSLGFELLVSEEIQGLTLQFNLNKDAVGCIWALQGRNEIESYWTSSSKQDNDQISFVLTRILPNIPCIITITYEMKQ